MSERAAFIDAILNNPAAMPPDEPKDARQTGIELLVDMYAGDIRYVLDIIEKKQFGAKAVAISN